MFRTGSPGDMAGNTQFHEVFQSTYKLPNSFSNSILEFQTPVDFGMGTA